MSVPYLGDYALSTQVVHHKFSTGQYGEPKTITSVTVKVYKDDDTSTEVTTGVTTTVDHDSLTGIHHVKVVLTDVFYATGHDYFAVLTAATLSGITIRDVLFQWSILNRAGNLTHINGDLTSGNNATLKLKGLDIRNADDTAVTIWATGAGNSGHGLLVNGGVSGGIGVVISSSFTTGTTTLTGAVTADNASNDIVGIDVAKISGNATTADNLESFWKNQLIGTSQAGGGSTITLASGASATNNFYNDMAVSILSGTGDGQVRRITGYVGATKVATVSTPWTTNPDNTSIYHVIGRIE